LARKADTSLPGLLMGLLQVGWMSVNTFVATTFVLTAFSSTAGPGSLPFAVIAAAWALDSDLWARREFNMSRDSL